MQPTTITEEERTIIRKRLLQALRTADPIKLKPARLLAGLEYVGYELSQAQLQVELRALVAVGFVEVEEDRLNAAESRYGFTESGRVYLSREGI